MINLNDVKLVPKSKFTMMLHNTDVNSVVTSCEERAFKSILVSKAVDVSIRKKNIESFKSQLSYYADLYNLALDKMPMDGKLVQKALKDRNYWLDSVDLALKKLNTATEIFNFYLDQINANTVDYVTLMMFPIEEWKIH